MRTYLDHNATTPLCPEARAAMQAAMDVVGNPSSVHAEGRAARGIIERARAQVAALIGCDPHDIVFTSGATEAASLWLRGRAALLGAAVEHDAVLCWIEGCSEPMLVPVDAQGQVIAGADVTLSCLQGANSETGVVQSALGKRPVGMSDVTQLIGKVGFDFSTSWTEAVILSAHKFGGPKGVGALVLNKGVDPVSAGGGGGQELGRRPGTENVIGIAGFGAAAEVAARDLVDGVWDGVAQLRDILETALEAGSPGTILVGKTGPRLPNTSCILTPGWKGETQVMQMDLAGFAVSAGSACSSGKVRASRVLLAMGYDAVAASSAIRVSLGRHTLMEEVLRFGDAWVAQSRKFRLRAA